MYLLCSVVLAGVIHEGGHWLAAAWFGHKLQFRFAWGRFGVPRFVWKMPHFYQCERWKEKVIALAGFGLELSIAGLLMVTAPWLPFSAAYSVITVLHLLSYPYYARGEANDFQWLRHEP